MKRRGNPFMIGIGVILLLCGCYWIYRGGEYLEIVMPFILGIGFIALAFYKFEDNITNS